MPEPPSQPTSPPIKAGDRLDSWKEIAAYLNRDVTTVQRWEKREGMPVHRHLHDRMGSVYALRAELDAWTSSRNIPATRHIANTPNTDVSPERTQSSGLWTLVLGAAIGIALAIVVGLWFRQREYFWRNPISDARFQAVTDFGGTEQAAAVSPDGRFVAFLSNRDRQTDVWVTQVGSGQFHNLTHGVVQELVNPSLRTLGFSPDGAFVTFWARHQAGSGPGDINVWEVPILGGEPKLYLEGVAEFDWTRDAARLAYHTANPGDPLFVSTGTPRSDARPIFTAPAGLHCHFPIWAPDGNSIYFVQGALPDKLDIWRIPPDRAAPQQITFHNASVSYPVFLDRRTLMYLAADSDGSGPWLYSLDVERRIPHRLAPGPDRYTSLAVNADGHRMVATLATTKKTLWALPIKDRRKGESTPAEIPTSNGKAFSPRFGPNYFLYISASSDSEGIWKVQNGTSRELWNGARTQIFGAPAISADGSSIAFSARQHGKTLMYVMHADGSNARVINDTLDLLGSPAWSPEGRSIVSAANDHGIPHLFRIPISGQSPVAFASEYALDPAWSPDGSFLVYSGADIGTTFSLKAIDANAAPYSLPQLTLTRGSRHVAFLSGEPALVLLRGEIQHKNLWIRDLRTGAERQLTNLAPEFEVTDFDISRDGREVVLERAQERSDIVLMDLPRQ